MPGYPSALGNFLHETLTRVTKNHQEHEFIFIFDQIYDPNFVFGSNVRPVLAGRPSRNPLAWKWWYDVSLPRLLKKYKADVFVCTEGICSLTTPLPQCLLIPDLEFLHDPSAFKKSHLFFYKRYTPKFLKKARSVITLSAFGTTELVTYYKKDEGKINIVPGEVHIKADPINAEEREKVKKNYTNGKEYLVYAGALDPYKRLVILLKAFSLFKKRQETNLQLVLVGQPIHKRLAKDLKTYKYRNDLVFTGILNEEERLKIISAAYGMVHPSLFETFAFPVLEAMRCGLPVIVAKNSVGEEIAGAAALLAEPDDQQDLAEKMMLLYKDEKKRSEMIRIGIANSHQFDWEKTAEAFWQSIQKAVYAPESIR